MKCPKCKSDHYRKDGLVKGKQRFECKQCHHLFTVELKSTAQPESTKRQALLLYLEGLGFRSIGRFLGVSHVAIYKWIKSFGQQVEKIKSEQKIQVVELDEMHTYISAKKNIAGSGLLLIEMGKNSSTAYWVPGESKQDSSSGNRLKTNKSKL